MKLSELEGKPVKIKISDADIMLGILKEIRPTGFFVEVTTCASNEHAIGDHLFISAGCRVIFSTSE